MLPLLNAVQEEPSAELAADVDSFTGALRRYAAHLEKIDYDLGALFETRRGKKLARSELTRASSKRIVRVPSDGESVRTLGQLDASRHLQRHGVRS